MESLSVSQTICDALEDSKLPLDVLCDIMCIADPSTITSLMATCRLLHDEAPRHLIRRGVVLRNQEQASGFMKFLFGGNTTRIRHLRNLEIGPKPVHVWLGSPPLFSWGSTIAPLLTSRELALDTLVLNNAEGLLSHQPDVSAALRTSTTLKHLEVHHAFDHTYDLLRSLPSRLITATISITSPAINNAYLGVSDPILSHSSDTLEALTWKRSATDKETQVLPLIQCTRAFPRLRAISILTDRGAGAEFGALNIVLDRKTITTIEDRDPKLDRWRLRAEGIDHLQTPPDPCWFLGEDDVDRVRHRNRMLHALHGGTVWPPLEECVGNIPTLYGLALNCTAPASHVEAYAPSAGHVKMLRVTLAEMRPERLTVDLAGAHTLTHEHGIFAALRAPEADSVRTLDLRLALDELDNGGKLNADMSVLLDEIVSAFAFLPGEIGTVKLVIDHEMVKRIEQRLRFMGLSPVRLVDGFVANLDLSTLSHRISKSSPSFADVRVEFVDSARHEQRSR